MFTFHKECVNKYGARIGPQIWEVINKVFDRMPVCAIVDENIFCAHGGIPTSVNKIEDLQKIPSPLLEPEGKFFISKAKFTLIFFRIFKAKAHLLGRSCGMIQ